jgi:hypothetical protein
MLRVTFIRNVGFLFDILMGTHRWCDQACAVGCIKMFQRIIFCDMKYQHDKSRVFETLFESNKIKSLMLLLGMQVTVINRHYIESGKISVGPIFFAP